VNKNIEGTMRINFAGRERDFKLAFRNLANIEDRLNMPVMQVVNNFTSGNIGVSNVSIILHEALLGAGGKYTYEAVGDMVLKHGFTNCLTIVSEILLTSMGLNEQNEQKLPLESNENQTEKQ
jgi:hypothetical protein|tara:strand:+ start:153 stop:518 length:366 start_codon:yes stop_codon:yes gene_type:complete